MREENGDEKRIMMRGENDKREDNEDERREWEEIMRMI